MPHHGTLDFETARQSFISAAPKLGRVRLPVERAVGQVLAESLVAPRPLPPFDLSAMDGFALDTRDIGAVPFSLPVQGESAAGCSPVAHVRGTAMRIFTGAPVPYGANAVVMQEHVVLDGQRISGERPVKPGQNVRWRGEDLAESATVLAAGHRLHPGSLGLVSFLDRAEVWVSSAPRVSILCTGNELRVPGSSGALGTIAECNSPVIAALTRQSGATLAGIRVVRDEPDAIRRAIEVALADCDVLVTIGGISVGDYDFVRPTLEGLGVELAIHQVGIKPGKPITLGRRGEQRVIGLPGNPLSAAATFAVFAMPLLRAMQGDDAPIPLSSWVPTIDPMKRDAARTRLVFGSLVEHEGRLGFVAHPSQSSGSSVPMGQSNGFAIVAPGEGVIEAMGLVPYHRWTDL
ncbi:MAG: molybdopterin molybdotransferase MoeA [Polyangiaceae bacterium]